MLIFCFTGCGSKAKDTTQYDQETLKGYSDMIIQSFSAMSNEELDNFKDMSDLELNMTLLQSGLPIEASNFVTMIEAWEAGIEECGELADIGSYEMETTNKNATMTVETKFAERDATIEFIFDEKMNMESMTVNADYSTGEILKKAGLNTILGMGTVFCVLIFISFIISLFKFIPMLEKKLSKSQATVETPAPVKAVQPEAVAINTDGELAAVIAAAIAASEGTSTDGFIVRSIKRRKTNNWN